MGQFLSKMAPRRHSHGATGRSKGALHSGDCKRTVNSRMNGIKDIAKQSINVRLRKWRQGSKGLERHAPVAQKIEKHVDSQDDADQRGRQRA